jgi:hypothetical protein
LILYVRAKVFATPYLFIRIRAANYLQFFGAVNGRIWFLLEAAGA